jgi:glycosyltransferase involved in cell wall biosynthesis
MVTVTNVNRGNMSTKFSVLMANYNNEKYISEAIESVLNQSFTDWELIVIDDRSTDNSVDIVEYYLNDSRIRLMKNNKNIGYTKTLIQLVSKAKSDIFGTLDSDDVLTSDALEEMYHAHETNPQSGLIYSQYIYCDKKLKPISQGLSQAIPNGSTNLKSMYTGAFRTFKRDIYQQTGGFNPKYIYSEDRDIVFKMEEVADVKYVDKPLYMHRVMLGSQSNDPTKKPIGNLFHIIAKYDAFCRRLGTQIPNLTDKEMSIELCIASIICRRLRQRREANEYSKLAFELNPKLFFSMSNYLFRKILTKINKNFKPRSSRSLSKYSEVNKEIRRQLRST